MAQYQPVPPDLERPWYYEKWFLLPAFAMGWPLNYPLVLWPVWAILIIRSPWHNQTLINGLAWANVITGAVLVVKNVQGPNGAFFAIMMILPGIVVSVITQVMWSRFMLEHGLVVERPDPPADPPDSPDSTEVTESRQSRVRRRSQRRRSSRSSRPSR